MLHLKDGTEQIIPLVLENRFYYNFVPLVIYLFVNMALGLVFAENYRYEQIMENSLEGVQRASEIITSLKFFANPGKMIKSENDLDAILFSVMLSIERKIPYNVSFSKELPSGIKVYCYEELIQQVISNIMHNALEAIEEMDEKMYRKIHISASKIKRDKKDMTCISIRNNEPSIPEADIKNIYDPFFTLKENSTGKGLGMSISYMIVKEHNGWIEARNDGEWVVFDVILPAGYRLRASRMACSSSALFQGFMIYLNINSLLNPSSITSVSRNPVNNMHTLSGYCCLISLIKSRPFITGILRSEIIT